MKALVDFPDWLGPMLVKELRQGLKSRGFVISFLTLQAVLIVVLIYNVLDYRGSGRDFSPQSLSAIFWTLIMAQLIFITPLRALNELAAERKANTLELLFLSGLSAWWVTFGKWVSLLFQAALFLFAVLPYAIIRYYFGGVNVTEDLTMMGFALLFCALLSAVALAISGMPLMARIAAMFVAVFFVMGSVPSLMFGLMMGRGRGSSFISGTGDLNWWIIILDFAVFSLVSLEIAAATVAPLAENHAGRQRAFALLAWLPVPVMLAMNVDEDGVNAQLVYFGLMAAVLSWHHLSSVPFPLQSFCRPFAGTRAVLGLPFQPGWPSAVVFLTVSLALIVLPILARSNSDKDWRFFAAGCIVGGGALLSSTSVWVGLWRRARWPLAMQTVFIGVCGVVVLLLVAGQPKNAHIGEYYGLASVPGVAIFSMWEANSTQWRPWCVAGGCAFAAYAVLLLFLSRRYWAHYFRTCRRLAVTPAPPLAS